MDFQLSQQLRCADLKKWIIENRHFEFDWRFW
jgi:hypothetical protein